MTKLEVAVVFVGIMVYKTASTMGIFYLAYFKLNQLEASLETCEWVRENKAKFSGNDPASRLYRLNAISMLLAFPWMRKGKGSFNDTSARKISLPLRYALHGFYASLALSLMLLVLHWAFYREMMNSNS